MVCSMDSPKVFVTATIALTVVLLGAAVVIPGNPVGPAGVAPRSTDYRPEPADYMDYSLFAYNVSGYEQYDRVQDAVSAHGGIGVEPYVYVTGCVPEDPTALYTDIYVAKIAANGSVVWWTQWGTPGVDDCGYGIELAPGNRLLVTGNTGGVVHGNLVLLRYTTAGQLEWSTVVSDPAGKGLTGYAVCGDNRWQGSQEGIYVTGMRKNTVQNTSIILIKFRYADGSPLWNRTYNYGGGLDVGRSVIATWGSTYSSVTVGGYVTNTAADTTDAVLLRYDHNGNLLWSRVWGDSDEDEVVEGLSYENYFTDSYLYGGGQDGGHGVVWAFSNSTGSISIIRQRTDSTHIYDIQISRHDVSGTVTGFIYAAGTKDVGGHEDFFFWKLQVSNMDNQAEFSWDSGDSRNDYGRGVGVANEGAEEELVVIVAGYSTYGLGQPPQDQFVWLSLSHDFDDDGLSNAEEQQVGTAYNDADSDDDGMPDGWEYQNGLNPLVDDADGDPDGDGLPNLSEYGNHTLPTDSDTDDDQMPDGWEVSNGLDPLADDSTGDPDDDDLTNLQEYVTGTLPHNNDTDSDMMPDGYEVLHHLDPLANDSADDYDGDGYSNYDEYVIGTLPDNSDTDNDTLPDGWEIANGTDPLNGSDSADDPDNDGLTNLAEYAAGTLPFNNDTDDDGMPDGYEVAYGLDPTRNDTMDDLDNDGVSNYDEYLGGTDPSHDEVPPEILSVNREPAAVVTSVDNVTLYIDARDPNGIQAVIVTVNVSGTFVNYTAHYDANLHLYVCEIPAQPAGTIVWYLVMAGDTADNWDAWPLSSYTVVEATTTTSTTTSTTSTTTTSTTGTNTTSGTGGGIFTVFEMLSPTTIGVVAVAVLVIAVAVAARRRR